MKKRRIYGVYPDNDSRERERAEACAAFAAQRGQKLYPVSMGSLMAYGRQTESGQGTADGFLIFLPEENEKRAPILSYGRFLKEVCPRAGVHYIEAAPDEKERVTALLAYWPSHRSIDHVQP